MNYGDRQGSLSTASAGWPHALRLRSCSPGYERGTGPGGHEDPELRSKEGSEKPALIAETHALLIPAAGART